MKHEFFSVGQGKDFIVFNSVDNLSNEDIVNEDLSFIKFKDLSCLQSVAWSSGCEFFFVILTDAIILCKTHSNEAVICKKLSYKFIELYLNEKKCKK